MLEVEGVTLTMSVALGKAGVKTVEDLADLSTDELRGAFESKGASGCAPPAPWKASRSARRTPRS